MGSFEGHRVPVPPIEQAQIRSGLYTDGRGLSRFRSGFRLSTEVTHCRGGLLRPQVAGESSFIKLEERVVWRHESEGSMTPEQ